MANYNVIGIYFGAKCYLPAMAIAFNFQCNNSCLDVWKNTEIKGGHRLRGQVYDF